MTGRGMALPQGAKGDGHMKCIYADFRRAITGRWFLAAFLASMAALYLSMGAQSYELLNLLSQVSTPEEDFQLDGSALLLQALQGHFGMLVLPALSALPFAGQALQEIQCDAIRPVIFRVGRTPWIAGKWSATLASGALVQLAAAMGLLLTLQLAMLCCVGTLCPLTDMGSIWPLLLRRMLCGGIWAGVGCLAALLTETAAAACFAPLCLCYAMMMIGTRFFPGIVQLNPVSWFTGGALPLLLTLAALAAALNWMLQRKVNACA